MNPELIFNKWLDADSTRPRPGIAMSNLGLMYVGRSRVHGENFRDQRHVIVNILGGGD